jgi:hypothetical protein
MEEGNESLMNCTVFAQLDDLLGSLYKAVEEQNE